MGHRREASGKVSGWPGRTHQHGEGWESRGAFTRRRGAWLCGSAEKGRGARPEAEIGHGAVLESAGEVTALWTETVTRTPGRGAFPVPVGLQTHPSEETCLDFPARQVAGMQGTFHVETVPSGADQGPPCARTRRLCLAVLASGRGSRRPRRQGGRARSAHGNKGSVIKAVFLLN